MGLKSNQKWPVIPITFVPLLPQWTYLARTVVILALSSQLDKIVVDFSPLVTNTVPSSIVTGRQ